MQIGVIFAEQKLKTQICVVQPDALLESMHFYVGGSLGQVARVFEKGLGLIIYVNGEGRLQGMRRNNTAAAFLNYLVKQLPGTPAYKIPEKIYGNLVICGRDEQGEEATLSEEQKEWIQTFNESYFK